MLRIEQRVQVCDATMHYSSKTDGPLKKRFYAGKNSRKRKAYFKKGLKKTNPPSRVCQVISLNITLTPVSIVLF